MLSWDGRLEEKKSSSKIQLEVPCLSSWVHHTVARNIGELKKAPSFIHMWVTCWLFNIAMDNHNFKADLINR